MSTPKIHDFRFEYRDRTYLDVRVVSGSLADARERGATLAGNQRSARGPLDWRGQVCFVACVPAEEAIAIDRKIPPSMLFDRRSVKTMAWI